jgi:hypothetical protein
MFLIVALVIVGGVSFVVARTIQHGIGERQPIGNDHGSSSPSKRTAIGALTRTSLSVAVFVPLLFVAYVVIGFLRHVLGQ